MKWNKIVYLMHEQNVNKNEHFGGDITINLQKLYNSFKFKFTKLVK